MDHLEWGLQQAGSRAALIVTESVFSMDGDVAPLEQISELAQDYDVRVVVDEAHATGCVGMGGRGAVADAGLEREIDVVVGTLGKALGSYGAFVACDAEMVSLLTNTARSLIFSTAPPPPAIAGALAALEVLEEQPRRVDRLHANAEVLRGELAREGFDVSGSSTQIVPLIVGDASTAMRVCEAALERGVFAQAIRPPTVPNGTSRLRLAVMATHTKDELRDAAQVLGRAALHAGFRPATAMPVAAAHEASHGEAPRRGALAYAGSTRRGVTADGDGSRHGAPDHGEASRREPLHAGGAPSTELFDAEAPELGPPAPRRIPRAA
jgi:7-keto-8-aminopelargonate synthetase-like enzyme